jgi:multidrug efflux system outer membrane protein
MKRLFIGLAGLHCVAYLFAGCAVVGPDYQRPPTGIPASFTEAGPWKMATPADATSRGDWWQLFGDPVLDDLERRARTANPKLQGAAARLEQARAVLGLADASRLPMLELSPEVGGLGVSKNRPDQPDKVPGNRDYHARRLRVPLYASYEVDLWGRLRRASEAARARLNASEASYQTLLLTLQGDVAQTYFDLRNLDAQLHLVATGVEIRRRARDLVTARWRGGIATELDVVRAETELATAEAELLALTRRRGDTERALAVLVGSPPGPFSIEAAATQAHVPEIPVGLPSALLERRPDVAEAERLLESRNAEIGVARGAFFPAVRLTGAVGFESSELSDLLKADSVIWGLAAGLAQPLFDGGRNRARLEGARAAYAESLALYRQQILVALSEVENALAALRLLDEQAKVQARAVVQANRAATLATARYKGGLVVILELIDAQRTQLSAEREALEIRNRQLTAGVALVKALGGGWSGAGSLPPSAAAPPASPMTGGT